MSNRCYLYACDADPGLYDIAPRGICEHVADLALMQLIMVAKNPRVVTSRVFEEGVAVLADSAGARERALAFVAKLAEGDVAEAEDFAIAVAQMQNVLASTDLGRYLLLEVGEVLDTEESVRELIGALAELDAQVERALAGEEDAWLDGLRATWQDSVMPWWANALYYSFDQPVLEWRRDDVEDKLARHNRRMTALLGHPFRYRLAPSVAPYQVRSVLSVLTALARDVEEAAVDARVTACEIDVHDEPRVDFRYEAGTLYITCSPQGWPSQGPKRKIREALGIAPPPTRYEYGRATV